MPDSRTLSSPSASHGPISSRSVSPKRPSGTFRMPRGLARRSRIDPSRPTRNARKLVVPQSTPIISSSSHPCFETVMRLIAGSGRSVPPVDRRAHTAAHRRPAFLRGDPMAGSLIADRMPVPHGFFTRRGGVSAGPFASLNCSLSSPDDPDAVLENRARVARSLAIDPANLLGLTQVHGNCVVTVTQPWRAGQGEKADAMVTDRSGLGLGIVTADCAPVLFADAGRNIV